MDYLEALDEELEKTEGYVPPYHTVTEKKELISKTDPITMNSLLTQEKTHLLYQDIKVAIVSRIVIIVHIRDLDCLILLGIYADIYPVLIIRR